MTPKKRMLSAVRGQMPDCLPFAPRIDLWFGANRMRGTLPERHRNAKSADEIALAEGWALHKVVLEFMEYGEDAVSDRLLGIYRIPTQGFVTRLPDDVEKVVEKRGDEYHVKYITPQGTATGCFVFSDEMRRSGISMPWIKEHLIKGEADYRTVGYIFANIKIEAAFGEYLRWAEAIGENGLPVLYALTAGSPMHHIMKVLMDSTDFYYRHRDQERLIAGLAERMGVYFRKVYDVIAQSPADVALVGANFDDMLTYPPFFEKHIMPWLQEAAEKLHAQNKLMLCHTDGENHGLMDLLHESGMDVAEAVCPHPMTKVTIGEYYRRWSDRITIFGGISSNLLLRETTSDGQFEKYLADLFPAIAPGGRFILGVADTTPPDASIERLRRIHELVNNQGRLPLEKKVFAPAPAEALPESGVGAALPEAKPAGPAAELPFCTEIRDAVMAGDSGRTVSFVKQAMERRVDPEQLLQECLLAPMDIIGEKFTDGSVFIPEVLLSARALNKATMLVEPALASRRTAGEKSPLVLSALLTTTMPEFKNVIQALESAGLRDRVKIMVGGAPVTEQYAKSVGADAYGADAGQAAVKAKLLCGREQAHYRKLGMFAA